MYFGSIALLAVQAAAGKGQAGAKASSLRACDQIRAQRAANVTCFEPIAAANSRVVGAACLPLGSQQASSVAVVIILQCATNPYT